MSSYSQAVGTVRDAFNRGTTKSLDFRINQLNALYRLLDENSNNLAEALYDDLRKPLQEALLTEMEYCKREIKGTLLRVRKWVQPEITERNILLLFDKTFIYPEPYGVVLIIGAWNYPLNLLVTPLLGAIAAGNCAIIKPSERTPATAKLFSHLIPKYLDSDCFHVVNGGPEETRELLKERFDYIFYTGSQTIGQRVREAANKHLTPVTLELGGKSPLYIDETVDMDVSCRRILWGKLLNAGQTCVAPDYLLCSKDVETRFIQSAKRVLVEFFGQDPQKSSDLSRINKHNFETVKKYLSCGMISLGGSFDDTEGYIAPTILTNVKPSELVMVEEVFGPILPIVNVNSPDEAIEFINKREKPLTIYVFSTNQNIVDKFIASTSSGSMCINDTFVHVILDTLPFGGVGRSGIGQYHGKYTFDTFSHKKAVLIRSFNFISEFLGRNRYPPLTGKKMQHIMKIMGIHANICPLHFRYMMAFFSGVISLFLLQTLASVI